MAKKVGYTEAPMNPVAYKPRVHIDLSRGQIQELEIGKKATLVLKGKVVSLEERDEILDYGPNKGQKEYRCSVCLEAPDVKVAGDNLYEEMAEEES